MQVRAFESNVPLKYCFTLLLFGHNNEAKISTFETILVLTNLMFAFRESYVM